MKRSMVATAGLLIGTGAFADGVQSVDRMVCSTEQIKLCVEGDECYNVPPSEASVPSFLIVDLKKKLLSTTKGSAENRTTAITSLNRADGHIYLQGLDRGRAFSFVIEEDTGRLTVAVSRDGVTVTVFGACTSTDL
jgi:hypothetical protein